VKRTDCSKQDIMNDVFVMVNSKLSKKIFQSMMSELWKRVIQRMTMKVKTILQIQMIMKA